MQPERKDEMGNRLDDTAKVLLILELLLERARQEGLGEEMVEVLYANLGELLDDNSEGVNTTLLEAIQIVLNR